MKSWKTTLFGVLSILTAVSSAGVTLLQGQTPDFTAILAALVAGVGLIFAKDATVTGLPK